MDKNLGLKRMNSNPAPAKVVLFNPNAPKSSVANDNISNNKIGSAPSLHNRLNSDLLPAVPSRNKTTENLAAPKKEVKRYTVEVESKSGITANRPLSVGPGTSKANILPPVAPRKVATASPTGSGEFTTIARDAIKDKVDDAPVPPPTAPRKIPGSAITAVDISAAKNPPPTAPRNLATSPPPTRHNPNTPNVASSPPTQPKLGVPPPTAPRGINDEKPLSVSALEGNRPPPVAPRVPSKSVTTSNSSVAPSSPVVGRNAPSAAAKKSSSNSNTPSTSGEFVIPKVNSGPKLSQQGATNIPPVAPRTTGDRSSNDTILPRASSPYESDQPTKVGSNPNLVPPPVAPRKVGERVNSKDDQISTPVANPSLIPPTAAAKKRDSGEHTGSPVIARNHGALASSVPSRSPPQAELRSSTPVDTKPKGPPPSVPKTSSEGTLVVVLPNNHPTNPIPVPSKERTEAAGITVAQQQQTKPPPKPDIKNIEGSEDVPAGAVKSPRPKSAPVKLPIIQANVQRKTVEDTLSPRSVISPRTPSPGRLQKTPISPRATIEKTPSPGPTQLDLDPVPTIVIDDQPKPSLNASNSAPRIVLQRDDNGQGVARYNKSVPLPPPPQEQDNDPQGDTVYNTSVPVMPRADPAPETQGVTHYNKAVRPPSPHEEYDNEPHVVTPYMKVAPRPPTREGDNENSLAPPVVEKRSSVDVDIDPIMLTLSPRTIEERLRAQENAIYTSGLDYYLDPENQFVDNFQEEGFIEEAPNNNENTPNEPRKSAWVKVTKPKSTVPRGDLQTPDLAKPRGSIDPDEFTARPRASFIANRGALHEVEPPEEDSGNENGGAPSDAPAKPKDDDSSDEENAAAAKAKKDLKKIQKFFTKVIPKKLGINKDKDGKDESSDSSSDEGKARVKTVGFEDPSLTPEEREARKKQLEEEERIRREEKDRRKQEKERLKREEKEREEKERAERDKIKAAEKGEKDRLKREEKEKEDKEKEERDKLKQAEKEEKERLRKEKEERDAKEAANKPATSTFKVDKRATSITKALPKLSEDDGNRLNHVTIDRPAFKGRRPPTRVLRPGIVTSEGDNEIAGQDAPTPATPMEL